MALALKAGKLTGGKIPGPVAKFLGLPMNTSVPIPSDLAQAATPIVFSSTYFSRSLPSRHGCSSEIGTYRASTSK